MNPAVTEIDILDPQTQTPHQPQSAAVEQVGHQPVAARELADDGLRLGLGGWGGESRGCLVPCGWSADMRVLVNTGFLFTVILPTV